MKNNIMPLKCSLCGAEFNAMFGGKCRKCGRLYCAAHLDGKKHKCGVKK